MFGVATGQGPVTNLDGTRLFFPSRYAAEKWIAEFGSVFRHRVYTVRAEVAS